MKFLELFNVTILENYTLGNLAFPYLQGVGVGVGNLVQVPIFKYILLFIPWDACGRPR